MYTCDIVKTFWGQCLKLLNRNMQNLPKDIILLLAKFHIYKSKMLNKRPIFSAFEYEFLLYLKAERISAVSNNKLKQYNIKWSDWKNYIFLNL